MTISKLLIVLATSMIVTTIMDINGYSFVSQVVVAGLIGAFLGFVDRSNDDTSKTP